MLELKGEEYEMEVKDWESEEGYFLFAASSTLLDGSETRPWGSAANKKYVNKEMLNISNIENQRKRLLKSIHVIDK